MEMGDLDMKFFLVFLAPTVWFAVWFAKRWVDDQRAEKRRQQE